MTTSAEKRLHAKKSQSARSGSVALTDFSALYQSTSDVRVQVIRRGVRAVEVKHMVRMMAAPQDQIFKVLKLSIATVNRKANLDQTLSPEHSERVVGIASLIGQVQTMVAQSGDAARFDAPRWVARWLDAPSPALGDECPASYMDTMEGQTLVSNLLAMMQSGAYA